MLELLTPPKGKLDCLKSADVLRLESFEVSFFHWMALAFFLLAIIHILSINWIHLSARKLEETYGPKRSRSKRDLLIQFLYFLSEIEIVFAFWAIPLLILIGLEYGWLTAFSYINTRDYTEALFVMVILCLVSTRPILQMAQTSLHALAKTLGNSLSAWWFTLLTLGPLLGSFLTEVGAMVLCALLLSRQFYIHRPSSSLAYGTLGLLFVNISIGGILTAFASPAVIVLSHMWSWTSWFMFLNFGWKAIIGILISNTVYWFYFRKEFFLLEEKKKVSHIKDTNTEAPTPLWVRVTHIIFVVGAVAFSHYPALFIGVFLLFLAFHQATRSHQHPIHLLRPLLIALFLAGIIVHGGVQGWWVIRALEALSPLEVMGTSILLTTFNDNVAISYLATLIPGWEFPFKYAIVTGIVSGGGLTIIANAPNPAGFSILRHHFSGGISPWKLFKAALLPTCILYGIYLATGPFFPL